MEKRMAQSTIGKVDNKSEVILSAATATGAGSGVLLPALNTTFQYEGITTATVAIQVSNDGSNWVTVDTATADGVYSMSAAFKHVRANVTAYTAGTINVILGW